MSKKHTGQRLSGAKNSTIQQEVEKANGIRVFHRLEVAEKAGVSQFRQIQSKRQREQRRCVVDLQMQKMQAFLEPHHL